MAILYQHEKQLLVDLAVYYEQKAKYCGERASHPLANTRMFQAQKESDLKKAAVLRKAAA